MVGWSHRNVESRNSSPSNRKWKGPSISSSGMHCPIGKWGFKVFIVHVPPCITTFTLRFTNGCLLMRPKPDIYVNVGTIYVCRRLKTICAWKKHALWKSVDTSFDTFKSISFRLPQTIVEYVANIIMYSVNFDVAHSLSSQGWMKGRENLITQCMWNCYVLSE